MDTTTTFHMNAGDVSEKHNMRDIDLIMGENIKTNGNLIDIDNELGDSFHQVVYRSNVKDKYAEIFGNALDKYNAKQKRSDRRMTVDDYMNSVANDTRGKRPTKLSNGKRVPDYSKESGKRVSYEVVVGVGNTERAKNEDGKVMYDKNNHHIRPEYLPRSLQRAIVLRYCEEFQSRNPNFIMVNVDIHGDELFINSRGVWEYGIIHSHIEFIPVAEGYKVGLEKQNSINKALNAMGIKNGTCGMYEQWCKREQHRLEEITCEMYADYCEKNPDYYDEKGDIHIYHPVTEKRRNGGSDKEIHAKEQELAEREANVKADENLLVAVLNQTAAEFEEECAERKKKLDEQEEKNKRDAEKNRLDAERNEDYIQKQTNMLNATKAEVDKEIARRQKELSEQEENIRQAADKNRLDAENNAKKEHELDELIQAGIKAELEKIIAEAEEAGDYQKANKFRKRMDMANGLTTNIDTDSEKKNDTSRYIRGFD